jgi:hypothetical protein
MGFMDKAKKMAEQAQAKLDEAQKQFNERQQQGQGGGSPVEYDEHGRPIAQPEAEAAAPPHGDPLAGSARPPDTAEAPAPPAGDAPAEDRNHPSYEPPKLTSGDPLAG